MAVLGMTCFDPLPSAWLADRRATKFHPYGNGTFGISIDLDSPECDQFLDFLNEDRRIPRTFWFGLYQSADWWKEPDDRWVGAIPISDDYVHVSPANTFDPTCPRPCYGLVPPHLPL